MGYVLIFLFWPALVGPPQVTTQAFTSNRNCDDAGKILTFEFDKEEHYGNRYGFEHRTKPKWHCLLQ